MWRAKDLSGLLLLYSAKGSATGMKKLVDLSKEQGKQNVAFLGLFLLGQLDECVDLLVSSGRTSEAAFFARTYVPSRMSEVCLAGSRSHDRFRHTNGMLTVLVYSLTHSPTPPARSLIYSPACCTSTHAHTRTHALTHSFTHSLIHSLTHSHTHAESPAHVRACWIRLTNNHSQTAHAALSTCCCTG